MLEGDGPGLILIGNNSCAPGTSDLDTVQIV